MRWYFERFSIEMNEDDVFSCSYQVACDDDVEETLKKPYIRKQLEEINDFDLSQELKGYGAWTSEDLSNRGDNEARIIWIAACNIREDWIGTYESYE